MPVPDGTETTAGPQPGGLHIRVLRPGLATTVQDGGRTGWRSFGVGAAGALDRYSLAIGNHLVGNAIDAAAVEISLSGPSLHFDRPARIALTGAEIDAQANGRAIPGWRPIDLPAATTLDLGHCRKGARAYLCLAGSLPLPRVLGSSSTDLRGGFGGMRGRPLASGDILPAWAGPNLACTEPSFPTWWIDPSPDIDFHRSTVARLLPGRDSLTTPEALYNTGWRIAATSDRQALRLDGPALAVHAPGERISEPVAPGTVQLPPDGRPIILLADAQTIGGYPRIGHIIAADLPRLAQLRPGSSLHLIATDHDQGWRLEQQQRARLARIGYAIAARIGRR
ncbi:MAG TPA: hypothetical protein DDZ76_09090 [Xanthomonadales bacterium]|nr:hypothetical protein [Xanthomonadales bacterium]